MKKQYTGKVVSNKMQQTVVVQVDRKFRHPLYHKLVQKRKKFYADTRGLEIPMGSKVTIIQSRPISKLKRWQVVEVVEQPQE